MNRLALVLILVCGCATQWKPLKPNVLEPRADRTIGVVRAETPVFYVATGGRAMTGLLGMAMMAKEGQEVVKEHNVPDPAIAIASRLSQALAAKQGWTARTPTITGWKGREPRWSTDLILRVKTEQWQLNYFATNWTHYQVSYKASLELWDERAQRVIASGDCESHSPDSWTLAHTFAGLLAKDAALLKRKLREAGAFCTSLFARGLFAIQLPEDPIQMPVADPKNLYASCNLEDTPEWRAADPVGKKRLLDACREMRRRQAAQPPPASPPPAATPAPAPLPPPAAPPPRLPVEGEM